MLTIISPATTMNFSKDIDYTGTSIPYFKKDADYLINILKNKDFTYIKNLMNLSDDLTHLNICRYKKFGSINNPVSPSIYAFDGEVFDKIDVLSMNENDINFLKSNLLILSGLYGCLKPFDLIEPYRLEMKSKLENSEGNNLYKFWRDKITNYLMQEISTHSNKTILNLASNEYVKAIDLKLLKTKCNFISIEFKDYDLKSNSYKVKGMYAKQARGYMAKAITKNKIDNIFDIKELEINGYKFNKDMSNEENLIFTRQ